MTAFLLSVARVGAIVLIAAAAGWATAAALLPQDARLRLERLGWSFALGCGLLAGLVPLSLLAGVQAGLAPLGILGALGVAAGFGFRLPRFESEGTAPGIRNSKLGGSVATAALWCLIGLGVIFYALRALTEPMWSNDFVAIWGLKGKTIFGAGALARLPPWPVFAHPEYPVGLPLLYAGVSFLSGRWDDHALGLLFPLFQVATLLVLLGWLRRRKTPPLVALLAAAILALFEPLYSGFLTGMAEVPLSFVLLLLGTALADALEETDGGAVRRLAIASALTAVTKNEGLFLAVCACALALLSGRPRRGRAAAAALLPAVAIWGLHAAGRGPVPLRDFDPSLFSLAWVAEALGAALSQPGAVGWVGLAAISILFALGARVPGGNRLLVLSAMALAAYVLLPVFAVRGPTWMIETTLRRTAAALAPLVAAGLAVRFPRG